MVQYQNPLNMSTVPYDTTCTRMWQQITKKLLTQHTKKGKINLLVKSMIQREQEPSRERGGRQEDLEKAGRYGSSVELMNGSPSRRDHE